MSMKWQRRDRQTSAEGLAGVPRRIPERGTKMEALHVFWGTRAVLEPSRAIAIDDVARQETRVV